MNKEWSDLNKLMQSQLKKRETIQEGFQTLFLLREKLWEQMLHFREDLSNEQFSLMPFLNATGYHSKSIAYSLWHIFRIEDIVAHSLIAGDEEIFFQSNYQDRIHSPIITTGNELKKEEIRIFSEQLNIPELYHYIEEVYQNTNQIISELSFEQLKTSIPKERKEQLWKSKVVSEMDRASWLVDYWCDKDVRGLVQMPFSRHWIMHVEACLRIKEKITRRKNEKNI